LEEINRLKDEAIDVYRKNDDLEEKIDKGRMLLKDISSMEK